MSIITKKEVFAKVFITFAAIIFNLSFVIFRLLYRIIIFTKKEHQS